MARRTPSTELVEVADGVWAYLQRERGWGWSNAGLVTGGDHSLLVDTLFDLALTGRMLEQLLTVSTVPVGTVVNTHANGDHTYGNAAVVGAQIVASAACAAEFGATPPALMQAMLDAAPEMGELGAYFADAFGVFDFDGIDLVPPTDTFSGRRDMTVGDRVVQLVELGPAHTAGDVIVHLPDDGVVFTGDLVFADVHPLVWAGPVQGWIDALGVLEGLEPSVVVPGHGPVGDATMLVMQRRYLERLLAAARECADAGLSVADAVAEVGSLGEESWDEPERLAVNMTAAYRDLGVEVADDVVTLFSLMASARR